MFVLNLSFICRVSVALCRIVRRIAARPAYAGVKSFIPYIRAKSKDELKK
jgi:hypothetical protein